MKLKCAPNVHVRRSESNKQFIRKDTKREREMLSNRHLVKGVTQ